jgi:hypothetical protein
MYRFVLLITCLALLPTISFAQTHAITPKVMEFTVEPRDTFEETIRITNVTDRRIYIYPTINEIALDEDGAILEYITPAMTDRTTAVTSWIEIQRSRVELGPRESVKLPVTFKIHFNAEPGRYHAFIGLAEASNQPEAEAQVSAGVAPGIVVRLDIAEDAKEQLELVQLKTNRFVFNDETRQLNVVVKNTGDIASTPRGEIILYDVRGNEVAALPINEQAATLEPATEQTFTLSVPDGLSIGRHKAFLQMGYGTTQGASVYDTHFFTVVPVQLLLLMFSILFVGTGLLSWWYHRALVQQRVIVTDTDGDVRMIVNPTNSREAHEHDINLKT